MTDFTVNLLTGIAQYLENAGVGTFETAGTPNTATTAICIIGLPQTPDRIVCLTDYPVEDSAVLTDAIVGLQVRCRGTTDPRTAADLHDAVFNALHGMAGQTFNTGDDAVNTVDIYRQSSTNLGPDVNGRWERSDNYYIRHNRNHPRLR